MTAHLPVLQVIIPLLAAPLCALARRGRIAWGIALATSWTTFWIAIQLLAQVQAEGPISYPLGGWAAPVGIEYRIDLVSAFVLVIVTAIGAERLLNRLWIKLGDRPRGETTGVVKYNVGRAHDRIGLQKQIGYLINLGYITADCITTNLIFQVCELFDITRGERHLCTLPGQNPGEGSTVAAARTYD